jgi:hypothetical protein
MLVYSLGSDLKRICPYPAEMQAAEIVSIRKLLSWFWLSVFGNDQLGKSIESCRKKAVI